MLGRNRLKSRWVGKEDGKLLFEEIRNNDLEGVVAKRKHGIYKSNGIGWIKIKNPKYSQAEGRHELMARTNLTSR